MTAKNECRTPFKNGAKALAALAWCFFAFFLPAARAAETGTFSAAGQSAPNVENMANILIGLSTGVMITATVYLFFIWLVIRDKGQIFLMLFLVALTVHLALGSDLIAGALGVGDPGARALLQNYGLILAHLFSLCFTYYFLEIDTNAPFMNVPLIAIGSLLLVLLFLATIASSLALLGLPLLGALSIAVVIATGFAALRLGVSGSLSHVIAFAFFFISSLAGPLRDMGYFDQEMTAFAMTNGGFAMVAGMFAIVIAGQFAARQDEKERALQRSNERFSLAVLGSNEGLFDWNLSTQEVYFSGQFRQIIGTTVGFEANKRGLRRWLMSVYPADRKTLISAFRKIRDSREPMALNFEYRIAHGKKGDRRWIHTKAVSTRDKASGRLTRIVGSIGDVTQRKMSEIALKASETRFRSITEAHPVPVLIVRLSDERILYASPGAETLLGLPGSALIAHGIGRFLVRAEERNSLIGLMNDGQNVDMKEVGLVHSDGRDLPAALSARRINYQNETAMVIGLYDLTERKKAETRIAQQQEALQQSEKMAALGGLLAGVAHELNNPLSVVVGQTTLLMETDTQPTTKTRAEKIFKAADRATRIVKSFLALARKKPPERKAFDLNTIINNSLDLLGYQIRNANVQLVLELDPRLPHVMGDSDQMTQVITNLALNAAQALQNWTGARRTLTLTSATNPDGSILVSVVDTGPGIPESLRARVFEPFFTTKSTEGGTGVGLALCHNIVEGHGGRLTIQDTPGGGATFLLALPAAEETTTPYVPDGSIEISKTGKYRLLIVDDEIELAQTLVELLEPFGHDLDMAVNGAIALEKLQKKQFDAIISDLRMPVMDGPSLYAALEEKMPRYLTRIIYVTGDTLSPHVDSFLKKTPVPVIEKPYRLADILKKLSEVLKEEETTGIMESDSQFPGTQR